MKYYPLLDWEPCFCILPRPFHNSKRWSWPFSRIERQIVQTCGQHPDVGYIYRPRKPRQ